MALGGILAVTDRRYRLARRHERYACRPAPRPSTVAQRAPDLVKSLRFFLPLAALRGPADVPLGRALAQPARSASPLIGKPAPAFQLPRLDDPAQTVTEKDLRGQVWLLNVWASWCVACLEEHPVLVAILAERACVPDLRAQLQGSARTRRRPGSASTATPTRCRSPIPTAGRHRLRRVRRARDLPDRQGRRDPLQADRTGHAESPERQDPAAHQAAAGVVMRWLLALLLCLLPLFATAKEAAPRGGRPGAGAARHEARRPSCAAWCARTSRWPIRTPTSPIDLRNQMREQMRAGKTDAEIKAWLTQRYGDFVLYRPPVKSTHLAAVVRPVPVADRRCCRTAALPETPPCARGFVRI